MILSFRHRGLADLFESGHSRYVRADLLKRVARRLDALDAAKRPEQLRVPGFDCHRLTGTTPVRFSIHVNGPWCITFGWCGDDAIDVDLVNYH
jgi:proteic killer suppression protein